MKLMMKSVIDKLTPHLFVVCDYLEYLLCMRNEFGTQNDDIHTECLDAVLKDWIATNNERGIKTLQKIMTILDEFDKLKNIKVIKLKGEQVLGSLFIDIHML